MWRYLSFFVPYQFSIFDDVGSWQPCQGLNSIHEDFNVQFSLRVFRSLHNNTVKMSEEEVLFMFYTFFMDAKVANLSEVKLYVSWFNELVINYLL